MSIANICVALLALLTVGLGGFVSVQRRKLKIGGPPTADPKDPLYLAVRAHGNTAEYAPILAILIYILGQSPQASWVIGMMIAAVAARFLFVVGILFMPTMARPNMARLISMAVTYIAGITLAIVLLLQSL